MGHLPEPHPGTGLIVECETVGGFEEWATGALRAALSEAGFEHRAQLRRHQEWHRRGVMRSEYAAESCGSRSV